MKKEVLSWVQVLLGGLSVIVFLSGCYTFVLLNIAGLKGVYNTPEEGMRSILGRSYSPDQEIKILYAGTNSFDGSIPHVWYVIAEVRASSHADGSPLRKNGCDSAGWFFLDTREGWVQISEIALPQYMGFWMSVFGTAGPGQSTPSTNWSPDSPVHYCQYEKAQ